MAVLRWQYLELVETEQAVFSEHAVDGEHVGGKHDGDKDEEEFDIEEWGRIIHDSNDDCTGPNPIGDNPSLAIDLSRRCASPRRRNNGEVARPSPSVSVAGSGDTVCKLTDEKLLGWARVAMVALSSLSHLSASLLPGIAGNQ
ncbi:uncharacterized protein [Triticum aestivum]|uniref:uncharacterized protein n=1 Tax=Triticum aestivum TaxID=4565 RepID=UPI001D01B82D|nr:uncharacterized protein LOC123171403 [Triticum aestivum]